MSSETCLFCNSSDKKFKSESGKDFICSQCVQLLLSADQAELIRAYNEAIEKGYSDKAKAIESFLIPEEINARETKIAKRNMGRKRSLRTVRLAHNQLRPQQATF